MKQLYAFASLGIPLCLVAAWIANQTPEEPQEQVPDILPAYSLQSQHFAMDDVASLMERMSREIRQNDRVSIGGISYPVSGFGGIELDVGGWTRGDERRTGVTLSFSSTGRTTPPTGPPARPRRDYDPYERSGRTWEPSAVADLLAELGQTLSGSGAIVLEHHRVPFRGAASIDKRLLENLSQKGRSGAYELEVNILFGEGEFEGPDDDSDYTEDQEYGLIKSVARDQRHGADRAAVAQVLASLAGDLRAGRVRVGDEQRPVGDTPVDFRITHVTAIDGSYDKIELTLGFGPRPPRMQPGDARYGDEQFNEPITDLAAILQRLGAQILEDGTFELGGQTFSAASVASWEIYANPRGFAVEVSYQLPPQQ